MSEKPNLLRPATTSHAPVTYVELFFDLVYVFAVTQISHYFLHNLTIEGALQSLVLWLAAWLGWQYNAWFTNWFNPETIQIRSMQFVIMVIALIMAAAIPSAYGERGLIFALCCVAIQAGRSLFAFINLEKGSLLRQNYQRILGWNIISAIFWIAGGLSSDGNTRLILWVIAVICEYISPMIGFRLPIIGRSQTKDWNINGPHLAERCQLFMIVALGETILITGDTLYHHEHWNIPLIIAMLISFLSTIAMWWMYFDVSSKDANHAISNSKDVGRTGASFHYVHAFMLMGVIIMAVANKLVMTEPDGRMDLTFSLVLAAGPMIFMIGNILYKKIIYGIYPKLYFIGLATLGVIAVIAQITDLLMINILNVAVMITIALYEGCKRRN